MKIALITTTINIPTVLALYRKLGPDVRFFVALDQNTPEKAVNYLKYDLTGVDIGWIENQQKYKCSELLGWNNDSRRNIALLEACKWGADIIFSCDDDMIVDSPFAAWAEFILSKPFSGVQFDAFQWFDAGQFTIPPVRQRGLPYCTDAYPNYSFADAVQIGAMQGIILGVPDTDASTTVVQRPFVHSASDVLKNGFVVGLDTHAVFNSQLTAFRRELAPAFFQFYKTQARNTDIIASVIMRRLMRDRNLYTYYGPPAGFHARTWRDPFKDMRAEQWGVENIDAIANYLDSTGAIKPDHGIVQQLRAIYADAPAAMFSTYHREGANAFLDDMESVL